MVSKKKKVVPWLVGIALITFMIVLAATDVFTPLAQYLHDYSITPLGALACFVAAVVIFYGVYKILVKLGESYLPDDDSGDR